MSGRSINQSKNALSLSSSNLSWTQSLRQYLSISETEPPNPHSCIFKTPLTDPNQHALLYRTVAIPRTGQGQLRVNLGIFNGNEFHLGLFFNSCGKRNIVGGSLPLEVSTTQPADALLFGNRRHYDAIRGRGGRT